MRTASPAGFSAIRTARFATTSPANDGASTDGIERKSELRDDSLCRRRRALRSMSRLVMALTFAAAAASITACCSAPEDAA